MQKRAIFSNTCRQKNFTLMLTSVSTVQSFCEYLSSGAFNAFYKIISMTEIK
jgi:hypothetical protein